MDIIISPGKLRGTVRAVPSKSMAHRALICAAFSDTPTKIICEETNKDIEATIACLLSLGATILPVQDGYQVMPAKEFPRTAQLHCEESASTLRFLLPIVGALGIEAQFHLAGRLPQRPLSPLWEEMERMGCQLSRPSENSVLCRGKLQPGKYTIPGNVSSQFVSGFLFATELLGNDSSLTVTDDIQSAPYIEMTRQCISHFRKKSHKCYSVDGDWSNAAFFLAANALGSNVSVEGLNPCSIQGDRSILSLLKQLDSPTQISAANIPDLVPILCIVAACREGAVFTHAGRLRTKESDRIKAVTDMINALGGSVKADDDTITVEPKPLTGGYVDSFHDHRIAMSAAIAATVCTKPVTINHAECVSKSYPGFWDAYARLGGKYEFCIRQ